MATPEREDRFRTRGSLVLYLVAVAFTIGIVIAFIAAGPIELRLLLAAGLLANVVYLVWLGRALAEGTAWARPVAILVLWFLVVAGVIDTLVALTRNRINIPAGALLALFALASPAGPIVLPESGRERARALQAIAIGALIVALPILLGLVTRGT